MTRGRLRDRGQSLPPEHDFDLVPVGFVHAAKNEECLRAIVAGVALTRQPPGSPPRAPAPLTPGGGQPATPPPPPTVAPTHVPSVHSLV